MTSSPQEIVEIAAVMGSRRITGCPSTLEAVLEGSTLEELALEVLALEALASLALKEITLEALALLALEALVGCASSGPPVPIGTSNFSD
ncbi:hypothetical protein F0562_032319 [Nyssa sinensis]|uniref:Uncharacterized protein n=1 Tax=Nyssa sinensis TaxID=561372 RepID=A0A5J5AR53_9ASTE|nr:hypothetical protein F0562_032319 [Nyssa sinensis]